MKARRGLLRRFLQLAMTQFATTLIKSICIQSQLQVWELKEARRKVEQREGGGCILPKHTQSHDRKLRAEGRVMAGTLQREETEAALALGRGAISPLSRASRGRVPADPHVAFPQARPLCYSSVPSPQTGRVHLHPSWQPLHPRMEQTSLLMDGGQQDLPTGFFSAIQPQESRKILSLPR